MTDETTDYLLAVAKDSHEKLNNPSIHSIPKFLANLGSGFMPYDDKLVIPSMIVTTLENPEYAEEEDKCDLSDENEVEREKPGSKKLWIAIGISLIFFFTELVGGLFSGSLALLSDSFHLLS
ncbi:3692_t:CDS:1, partial [Acaulospora morrowiae]